MKDESESEKERSLKEKDTTRKRLSQNVCQFISNGFNFKNETNMNIENLTRKRQSLSSFMRNAFLPRKKEWGEEWSRRSSNR